MRYAENASNILNQAINFAREKNHEYVTPEHLLFVIAFDDNFINAFEDAGGDVELLRKDLDEYLNKNCEVSASGETDISYNLKEVLRYSEARAISADRETIELTHILDGIMNLQECYAAYFIVSQGIEWQEVLSSMCSIDEYSDKEEENKDEWLQYVTCLNDIVDDNNPLIGREYELERTIQILCRRYKNNPIHIGEAGVGKTAITYGLVKLINEGKVPSNLKNAKVYSIELSTLVAGTQFRGDFEKRFKKVMEGISSVQTPIVYIDEIHTIIGAGSVNGGSLDASNMLKPYLAQGKVRFIGATTYEEYNKYFAKSKSLLRRFQKVDIKEPSIEESIEIINGLKKYYEEFHNVKYSKGVIEHAVNLSSRYINDRFLPDKAIDLIDEAGAYRVLHPLDKKTQTVDKKVIEEVLSKTCNIPKKTVESDEIKKLKTLEARIKNVVFGQDEAVKDVVQMIKLSRAGLGDDNKPIASFLFVGPTGVGKTEIARTLAKELDVNLVRFDMSEYTEKHSVAKLIGSPAGYVGYEEGGLLTDEIRKHPSCVLLLDEIEKAHSDIYNILLQVMDYATLTDNKGKKTDFKNVIIIMTSNAGASKVNKKLIGFGDRVENNTAIEAEVKKVFKPEFRNRLNKIIVFNGLNDQMAEKIVEKNINILKSVLESKNIKLSVSKDAMEYIKEKGITKEYGAREIARVIENEIKPLLVNEMLFGKLKKGGICLVNCDMGKIKLEIVKKGIVK